MIEDGQSDTRPPVRRKELNAIESEQYGNRKYCIATFEKEEDALKALNALYQALSTSKPTWDVTSFDPNWKPEVMFGVAGE